MTKKIQLIIGSTREGRIATSVAEWIESQAIKNEDIELEVVDLKEVNLPFFNDATPPAYGPTSTDAGKAWSAKIREADGFIFLTPEYNRGYPAALKNAIDYLYAEWANKPATIVSYGYTNGGRYASKQLNEVLDHLKVVTSEENVAVLLEGDMFNEDRSLKDVNVVFAQYEEAFQTALTYLVAADEAEAVIV